MTTNRHICFTAVMLVFLLSLYACQPSENRTEAWAFSNDDGHRWGLIRTDGTVLVPTDAFSQRPSSVVGGMFSLPDDKGRLHLHAANNPTRPVTPRSFARIGHFFADVTLAQETTDGPILLIDKQGRDIASTAQYTPYAITRMHNFSEGRALFVTAQGKYGYMDTQGHIVVQPVYDIAYDYHEGVALTGMENSRGETGCQLIDRDGKVSGNIRVTGCLLDTRLSEGLLLFKEMHTGHIGFLDKQGNTVSYLPETILQASRCQDDRVTIRTKDGSGCMTRDGRPIIPPLYEATRTTGKGRIAVRHNGQWQLTDLSGEVIANTNYDTISNYAPTSLAIARKGGNCLLIDRQGNAASDTYTQIVEDSTASHHLPQVFTIDTATAETADTSATARHRPDPKPEHRTPAQSRIEAKDWREVASQHPFYEEAVKVTSGKLEETDAEHRRMILNYVEHLRTSYTTKDIDFLEQLFSENALIVVGTVVHTAPREESGYLPPEQVVYNVKSKRQYLERLRQVFKANHSIDVTFSDFRIMRHPTKEGIYGVSLRQKYRSDIYSDDGYLFLLWDFRDETAPQIHVRTWQPSMRDNHTPLPENELFNIRNFNLE